MEHLRGTLAFITAAREGSFTRAAQALELSPQAVAASIARLETALDARLFNRTTRSIALTEEGQAFLAQAEIGLAALENAAQSIRDKTLSPAGVVRVTTGAAFGRRYLLPHLPHFSKQYPDVRLEISMEDRKVDLVRDGFDVAIRGGTIADSSLVSRRVCALETICVASPSYLRKHGVPQTPDDLHAHRIISLRFASGMTAPWEFKVKGRATTFEPRLAALTLSDTESVGDAAVMGLGITRVSTHFAWNHLQNGKLKALLLPFNNPGAREMVIHYPHRSFVAPRVKAFVEFLLETFKAEKSLHVSMEDLRDYAA
jgi:DNA-binding transcriptional LysR family regulator